MARQSATQHLSVLEAANLISTVRRGREKLHYLNPVPLAVGRSRVTFTIEPYGAIVRLTVTHENLADRAEYEASASGWPAVLANLKSFLETGHALRQEPWEMPAQSEHLHPTAPR